ncbi:MAG TPA: hypothetical protein VFD64_12195 [Gemmatimonadaceae bacterium]|nr:hypothetical protein [Gemmatimonadaceae bacterium]
MLSRGLIARAELRAQYAQIEPELYRYPAIDPASFRQALESLLEG